MILSELKNCTPGATIIGNEMVELTGLEYDSRRVQPGSLFLAVPGFVQDGGRFIDEAIRRGACAVAAEKEYQVNVPLLIVPQMRPAMADLAAFFFEYDRRQMTLIGTTGTNGKTSSCILLQNIISSAGNNCGLLTSLFYDTGSEELVAERTTPEAVDLFRMLKAMRQNDCYFAAIEVSSHALKLNRVKNLEFQVGLFTNFSRDHLDFHGSMDQYLAAKRLLLEMVDHPDKWAVINYDCPEFRPFIKHGSCSHLTYSLTDSSADIYLESFQLFPSYSEMMLHTPMKSRPVRFNLPGRFNLYNALAASAAAIALGIEIDAIVSGLEQSDVIPGRLEPVPNKAPFALFVDYAHTPDALKRTIASLRELDSGRILTLFGCGGDRDRGKRAEMVETVTNSSDYSVLTSDNPRDEDPQQIFSDAQVGLKNGAVMEIIEDRASAIEHILKQAQSGDMVLLAGKGAENYQEIKGVRYPFLDKKVATEVLHKMGYAK